MPCFSNPTPFPHWSLLTCPSSYKRLCVSHNLCLSAVPEYVFVVAVCFASLFVYLLVLGFCFFLSFLDFVFIILSPSNFLYFEVIKRWISCYVTYIIQVIKWVCVGGVSGPIRVFSHPPISSNQRTKVAEQMLCFTSANVLRQHRWNRTSQYPLEDISGWSVWPETSITSSHNFCRESLSPNAEQSCSLN